MLFSDVANIFGTISGINSRLKITEYLADLFNESTPKEAGIISYLSLGKLRAVYLGNKFNFSSKGIAKVLAELLEMTSVDVEKQARVVGDFGNVVSANEWKYEDKGLSLEDVYNRLCELEKTSGVGSQEKKQELFKELLSLVDALSAKFIVRIISEKLRMGFSDMTIVDALSWMIVGSKAYREKIEHAYNICADIGLIANTIKHGGIDAIEEMKIRVGIPIRPASAERLNTAEAIIEKIGPCVAQQKLDGFRLQIHLDKKNDPNLLKFFSRNMLDMSDMFPDLNELIKDLDVEQIICEGEAIAYDENTGAFVPFQETVKRKRKHGIGEAAGQIPLKVFIFDILYLNGESLLGESHERRRKILLDVFKNTSSNVQVIEEKQVRSADELEEYFSSAMDKGLEGLVVKRPDAIYRPGKRNFNWIKIKKHSSVHLDDTIDCVILGYYHGLGRRSAFGIGAFLVGVYNKEKDCFQTVAKVGTGMSDEDWKELKERCDEIQVVDKPKNIECASALDPNVWVVPSIVCMIRADEISISPIHAAGKTLKQNGYALRFPRFMGYRPDKTADQATDVSEIKNLYKNQ